MMKLFSKMVCVVLGAVLGAAACGEEAVEYGMPHAHFKLDGQVVASTGSQPIEGIQVEFDGQTVLTDSNGNWAIDYEWGWPCGDECEIVVRDIDGTENGGEFQEKTVTINPTKTADGDGDWDGGTFEQSDIEVQLDEV